MLVGNAEFSCVLENHIARNTLAWFSEDALHFLPGTANTVEVCVIFSSVAGAAPCMCRTACFSQKHLRCLGSRLGSRLPRGSDTA